MPEGKELSKHVHCSWATAPAPEAKQLHEGTAAASAQESIPLRCESWASEPHTGHTGNPPGSPNNIKCWHKDCTNIKWIPSTFCFPDEKGKSCLLRIQKSLEVWAPLAPLLFQEAQDYYKKENNAENTGGEKGSQALNCNFNSGQYRAFNILLNFANVSLTLWYHTEYQQ